MARIPEDEVERLKREISVQRLAEMRGIKLTRQGANLLGRCPFHDDKTPSLVITPAKNLWHCMGACSMGGTAIDWVMKAEGISFRNAVELLRKDHLPLAASPIQPVKKCTVPKLPAPLTVEAGDRELLLEVVGFYQSALTQSPEAMRYLETRGLRSSEMVERFRLGFANRTLGYGLEAKNRAGGAAVRGRLQRLGIYRESGHEHFNGSLVVPVINPAGDVLEMYGRKITPNLREGTPNHLYLPGEHRGVWNEEALIASREIILCEALIDALTFWAAGFRNVTASYGTNGFTADLHIPSATWFRFRRAAQESDTIFLLLTQVPCARSSALCVLDCSAGAPMSCGNLLNGLSRTAEVARQRLSSPFAKKAPGRAVSWQAASAWMRAAGQ